MFPVTPVPDHVPPVVPVTCEFKLIGASIEHNAEVVQVAVELGTTVI